MLGVKRTYVNFLYVNILTVASCALLWTTVSWQKIISLVVFLVIFIAYLLDSRYMKFFR